MSRSIDLNADLGETDSAAGIARDIAMMEVVSSCNIACGGHAGSREIAAQMLTAATRHQVAPGAHPSYPDRPNFGRSTMEITTEQLARSLDQQVEFLLEVAGQTNTKVTHIKPHGALYNDAQDNEDLAWLLVKLAQKYALPLVGMSPSVIQKLADGQSISFIAEAFVDRRYTDTARLVPRSDPGAVLSDQQDRLDQGLALALEQPVTDARGQDILIEADTLCLHSDSDGALETARAMRRELHRHGIEIAAQSS